MTPDDLKDYRPSENDPFVRVTGDAAVFWFCAMVLLGWVCGR